MVELIRQFTALDLSPRRVVDLVFRALCNLDRAQGVLSFANFKAASNSLQRQPKLEALQNASVLELYLLVSMKRLEGKEQDTNFNAIYKGEQSVKSTITGLSSE
jgi:origin recognition complex subunit 4